MEHFAGLDISVKDTSVCIVDDMGKIVREVKVASEPDALLAVLTSLSRPQFGRAVLQQDQAVSAGRNALRQARGELPRLHPACVHQAMAAR